MPSAKRSSPATARKPPAPSAPVEVVDPRWLLKALALSLGLAVVCAYLTACLLFYQGLWQLVLHPSLTLDRTPENIGLAFTPARFGDFDTGEPHLSAWWVPSSDTPDSRPAPLDASSGSVTSSFTILYLHGGSGSLSDTLPTLALLHRAGFNVFAIDYRGFGASDPAVHPNADRMQQDADAALDYLVTTRHVPLASILPMGSGLGAPLAVQLARDHSELAGVILDNPDPDPAATAAAESSRLIPVRLLFGSRFAIAKPLNALSRPKLLLVGRQPLSPANEAGIETLYRNAASPKYVVVLPLHGADSACEDALRRFLDDLHMR
ncbi:MAG TPA: alpha/beta fold hydrolase [Acidobacteriaceae bacterium]|nr:alpha/beta fold hydrolase [Acidobacteriaceae bacterium]